MAGFCYIFILIKSEKGLKLVFQSPTLSEKHVTNVCHTAH